MQDSYTLSTNNSSDFHYLVSSVYSLFLFSFLNVKNFRWLFIHRTCRPTFIFIFITYLNRAHFIVSLSGFSMDELLSFIKAFASCMC